MEKRNRLIYYAATGLLTPLMIFSAGMYIYIHAAVAEVFADLEFRC